MNMSSLLPYRWRAKLEAGRHNEAIIGILQTPPIASRKDGLVIFSMIGSQDVLPYLVAVKSLWRHLKRGRIAILDDGTLTAADRAILAQHCGDPQIFRLEDVPRGHFPQSSGWERLLTILDHRAGEYWLQLDSATVTMGPVWELERAISANRSFTLLGGPDAADAPMGMAAFARLAHPGGAEDGQIQMRIESRMGEIAPEAGWKYVRGSAAFAGFSAGRGGRELAGAFFSRLKGVIGEDDACLRGTDQVTSNFLVANEGSPLCLSQSRYSTYSGEPWDQDTAFVHFPGSHRYDHGAYVSASLEAIAELGG